MEETKVGSKKVRLSNFIETLIPIVVMMGFMLPESVGKTDYTDAHMSLIVSICVTYIIGGLYDHNFSDMLADMLDHLNTTMKAILVLCTVGILVASFIMSDTILAAIYYGLDLLASRPFLPVGCIMCTIVGLAYGSPWIATVTIGIASFGIDVGLGINPAITVDMIISGAYLGGKFPPLSDTTNLTAAVFDTGLFDHVTAMVSTTTPTFVITLILYTILDININAVGCNPQAATGLQIILASKFNISPLLLIPTIVVIAVYVMKLPGLVGIAISVFYGVLFAAIFQDMINIGDIFGTLHYDIMAETGNKVTDKLLNRDGMDHQMQTINLILLTVAYGDALERCGCVDVLLDGLKNKLHSAGQLVFAALPTSLFCDTTMCDRFLGIGVPALFYSDKYDEMGFARSMLSRTLEDYGILQAVMFLWAGCGAYQVGVLSMHPFACSPSAFISLLNPIYAVITASFGRNVLWAGGAYTNIFGKIIMHKPAGVPEEVHEAAVRNLERLRVEGKAPKVGR